MSKNLQVLYIGNDAMFEGIYLSILTILRRTKSTIDFYCISGDLTMLNPKYISLTKYHAAAINKLVKEFNSNNTFTLLDCSKHYFDTFKNKEIIDTNHWTPYTLFRLYIDCFKFNDNKLLYLDVDIIASGDIKEAFDVELGNNELCVCHDRIHWKRNNKKWFNAGAMLINLNQTLKTNLFKKSLDYCILNKPAYMDQDSLNLNWTKIMFWSDEYRFNYQPNCGLLKCKTINKPVLFHFFGKWPHYKPWQVDKFLKELKRRRIHNWDSDFPIYIQKIKNC